jgi:5-oxoprolinase (ATP-hydrolysing)
MTRVFIHPLAGVLSAYGMGLADGARCGRRPSRRQLSARLARRGAVRRARRAARARDRAQGIARDRIRVRRTLHLKYDGTDTTLEIEDAHRRPDRRAPSASLHATFEREYRTRYGFLMPGRALVIEAAAVEAIGVTRIAGRAPPQFPPRDGPPQPLRTLASTPRARFTTRRSSIAMR